jgi:hypothetical protein
MRPVTCFTFTAGAAIIEKLLPKWPRDDHPYLVKLSLLSVLPLPRSQRDLVQYMLVSRSFAASSGKAQAIKKKLVDEAIKKTVKK